MPFREKLFDFRRLNLLIAFDKPTCKMYRWLRRCAAKDILLRGAAFVVIPSAAISNWLDDGFGNGRSS